jgi:hypothetical protein
MKKPPPFHFNHPFPNMPNNKREFYYGDTVNTLGREDCSFQWFEAFKWYTTLSLEENSPNNFWISGIALVGFMMKVSHFKGLIF